MHHYIDSHAHLFLPEFDENRKALMQRAEEAGVHKVLMPNIDSSTINQLLQTEKDYPGRLFAMMGLHPCSVNENISHELETMEHWLSQRKFSAVGEIGLDFYWDVKFKKKQIEAFETQIDWALQYDLPVVIHSRNSTGTCIDIVRSKQNGHLKGVFHCFSGTEEEAQKIIGTGFYLGIGGIITFKKSPLPEIVKNLDLSHILLETDAPYLAPVPHRGKTNESAFIPIIANKIAEIKGTDIAEVSKITTDNAEKLFGI